MRSFASNTWARLNCDAAGGDIDSEGRFNEQIVASPCSGTAFVVGHGNLNEVRVGVFEVVEAGDGDFGARGVGFLEQNFVLGSTEAAGVPRASASRGAWKGDDVWNGILSKNEAVTAWGCEGGFEVGVTDAAYCLRVKVHINLSW